MEMEDSSSQRRRAWEKLREPGLYSRSVEKERVEGGEGHGESEHEAPDVGAAGSHHQVTLWATSSRPSARKSQTMTNAPPALQTKAPSLSQGDSRRTNGTSRARRGSEDQLTKRWTSTSKPQARRESS